MALVTPFSQWVGSTIHNVHTCLKYLYTGGTYGPVKTVVADYEITIDDRTIVVDSAGPVTLTLPDDANIGQLYKLQNIGVGTVTIAGGIINQETEPKLYQYECFDLVQIAAGEWEI